MEFKCPLCCNETFDSIESVREHLLNLLDKNIKCPICEKNIALVNYTEHLRTCEVPNKPSSSLMDFSEGNVETPTKNNEDYFCQICDVHFKDMKKHLKEFHMGEQVVVESEHLEEILDESSSVADGIAEDELNTQDVFFEQEKEEFYTENLTQVDEYKEDEKTQPVHEEISFGANPNDDLEHSFKVYRCVKCDVRYLHLRAYNAHKCGSKKGVVCDICSIYFSTKSGLSQHKKKYHAEELLEENMTYSCDICKIEFSKEKSVALHKRIHNPKSVKKNIEHPVTYNTKGEKICEESNEMFTCEKCGKEYNKKYEVAHLRSHNEEILNCTVCNREFPTKNDLNLHLQAHGNDTENKMSCRFCKKVFSQKKILDDHIKHQCEERKYRCSFCDRRFTKPHEKVKHERIHTGQKPHICEICGKKFRVSYCLTLHLRTHSGVRPYECKTCGKRFKSHGSFSHHVQIHSDVRSYKCPFCPKAFKTSVQLAGHRNSHTKPFSCDMCNRPFASLYAVKMHMKCHDRLDGLRHKCHICGAEYLRNIALRDHLMTHPEVKKEELEIFKKKNFKRITKLEEGEVVLEDAT